MHSHIGIAFTQSEKWLEFQKSLGRKGWLIKTSPDVIGVVIKYDLPFGLSYLYCPHGPIILKNPHPNPCLPDRQALPASLPTGQASKERESEITPSPLFIRERVGVRDNILQKFLDEIREIAEQENAIFFRCDPQVDLDSEKYGFKKAPSDYYFSATAMPPSEAILDISNSEETLLAGMKPKTRYNIHLAEKKGIIIKQTNNLDVFYDLLQKTAKRERINLHNKIHYQKLMQTFGENIVLFIAYYENQPIAGILILFYNKIATYLHGGFDDNYRQLMSPYLLQWRAIQEAKKRGCEEYDFGGAMDINNHPWSGVTRFKLGFGAKVVEYPGAYDIVFRPAWCILYNLIRKFRFK